MKTVALMVVFLFVFSNIAFAASSASVQDNNDFKILAADIKALKKAHATREAVYQKVICSSYFSPVKTDLVQKNVNYKSQATLLGLCKYLRDNSIKLSNHGKQHLLRIMGITMWYSLFYGPSK